jgi:hypothetical protein
VRALLEHRAGERRVDLQEAMSSSSPGKGSHPTPGRPPRNRIASATSMWPCTHMRSVTAEQ